VPGADQWIYTLQMSEAPAAAVVEMASWIRYDGSASASEDLARKGQRPQLIVTPLHLENGGGG